MMDFNNTSFVNSSNTTNTSECFYHSDNVKAKFFLLAIFSPIICLFGVTGNACALAVYMRKHMRSLQHSLLAALAVSDAGVLLCFVMIYTIENLADVTKNFPMYKVWVHYAREMFLLAHFFKAAGVYLTVAASTERFIATICTRPAEKMCKNKHAIYWIALTYLMSFGISFTKYFEIGLSTFPQCPGFSRYRFYISDFAMNELYIKIYTVWLSNLLITWLPFLLLLVLNVFTAYVYNSQNLNQAFGTNHQVVSMMTKLAYLRSEEGKKLKSKKREATILLIIIVAAFLICNTPDLLMTLTENFNPGYFKSHPDLYSFAKDTVNILAIIQSSINFCIYMIFGAEFRHECLSTCRPSGGRYNPVTATANGTQNPKFYMNGASVGILRSGSRTPELSEAEYSPRCISTTV